MLTRCIAVVLSVVLIGPALAAPEKVTPNLNWIGVINDEKLKKEAPASGVVLDAKAFEKLWKAWRGKEKVPMVDFDKEFVVVTLASGPNRPGIGATLDEGNLKILARQTLIGGDGFGYSLATFDRKGVKKVNGKDLPAK